MGTKNRSWIQRERDAEKHFMEWSKRTGVDQMYMNVKTGSIDDYNGWFYENRNGEQINAVDQGEVVPVIWEKETETWKEAE